MATLTATRAASAFPAFKASGAGILCAAYGSYDLTANPSAGDIIQLCKLPPGAVVLGGFMRMEDLDTNVTPTIDIDVGWAANGAEAADSDGFGNFGVLNGGAVTNYLPEGGALVPLHGTLKDGVVTFTEETTIQATVVAAAATFAAGTVSVVVHYVVP
jgi:hypothetical protein